MGDVACISAALGAKVASVSVMGERLRLLTAHDSILLPLPFPSSYTSFGLLPVLSHIFFMSMTPLSVLLLVVSVMCPWLQASLPVSSGGLGFRSAVQLAPSAFLASAAVSLPVFSAILVAFQSPSVPFQEVAFDHWSATLVDVPPPSGEAAGIQRAWDFPQVSAAFTSLCDNATNTISRARLQAVSTAKSGLWLNALPLSSVGLRMDDTTIRIAVGLRLGLPLCHPHSCHCCGGHVDEFATHGLSCRCSKGRHLRHSSVNSIVQRALSAAGVSSRLEPSGVVRLDGKRPDGVTMVPWSSGKPLVWDATCPNTLAPSHVSVAVHSPGSVAKAAEVKKCARYESLNRSYSFTPVAIEILGAIGPMSLKFLRALGTRIMEQSGEVSSILYLLQCLLVAVQRANAVSVMGTLSEPSTSDLFFLTQLVTIIM